LDFILFYLKAKIEEENRCHQNSFHCRAPASRNEILAVTLRAEWQKRVFYLGQLLHTRTLLHSHALLQAPAEIL